MAVNRKLRKNDLWKVYFLWDIGYCEKRRPCEHIFCKQTRQKSGMRINDDDDDANGFGEVMRNLAGKCVGQLFG